MKSWLNVDALKVSPHQKEQIALATSGPIGILTGGPGCGKSFSTKQIFDVYKGYSIALCPTGIAASRLRQIGCSANASTIHSALEPSIGARADGRWTFNRNRSNPLDAELIVVDESSMLPNDLFSDLLQAVKRGTKILCVGDPHQLSPVGAGRPFIDMISAGLPHGHLEEIWRFAGRIAEVCKNIRLNQPWESSKKLDIREDIDFPENFLHVESPSAAIPGKIKSFVEQFVEQGFPIGDIQVVTPCNDSGELSRQILNRKMQNWFNQHGEIVIAASDAKCGFRVGDKVMNLDNAYIKLYGTSDEDDLTNSIYVANGDVGVIVGTIENKKKNKIFIVCEMASKQTIVVDSVKFRESFTLSYCVTGHKVQGNQFPIVIVIADDSSGAKMVTDRSWYYTAYSRGSRCLISLGPKAAITAACKVARIEHRTTFLSETISEFHRKLLQGA